MPRTIFTRLIRTAATSDNRFARALLLGAGLALASALTSATPAHAQAFGPASAFTYQGVLSGPGSVASRTIAAEFELFDAPTDGNRVGPELLQSLITDAQGRFITNLDFGPDAFSGGPRWLQVVIYPDGQNAITLLPRQQILTAPSATYAATAGSIAAVTSSARAEVDQDVPRAGGALSGMAAGATWQSLTVGASGLLTRLDLSNFNASGNATLRIFRGNGVTGTPVAEIVQPFVTGGNVFRPVQQTFTIPSLRVTAGEVITWQLLGSVGSLMINSGYPRGNANPQLFGSNLDFSFRTYVTALAPLTLNGAPVVVPESLHIGARPAPVAPLSVDGGTNLAAAQISSDSPFGTWLNLFNTTVGNQFWRLIASGSQSGGGPGNLLIAAGTAAGSTDVVPLTITPSGRIGINTLSPQAALHIAGPSGSDAIRFPDGTVQTTAFRGLRATFTAGASIANPNSLTSINVPVPGAAVDDAILTNPRLALPTGLSVAAAAVTAPGTITLQIRNSTALPVVIGPTNLSLDILIMR